MWAVKQTNLQHQRGMTLIEVAAVAVLVGFLGLYSYSTLMEELEFRQVVEAANRAKIIATAIESAKQAGEVTVPFVNTLNVFKNVHGNNDIEDYMPELNNTTKFFDKEPEEFFNVSVNDLTTLVSFTLPQEKYFSIDVVSAGKQLIENQNNEVVGVTFTVMPNNGHGLFSNYTVNQYINAD